MAIIKPSKSSWWQGSCFTRQPPHVTVNIKLGSFRVHWRGILVDRVLPVRPSTVCRKFVLVRDPTTRATLVNSTAPDACGKVSRAKVEKSTTSLLEQFRIPPMCGTLKDTQQREIFLARLHDLPLTRAASTQCHTQFFPKGPSETLAGHPPSSDIPSHVRCLAPLDCLTFTCYVTCSVTCLVPRECCCLRCHF